MISPALTGASTDEPHDYVEDQTKHAILDHEQSFPYALNNASQDAPLGTPRIEPRTSCCYGNTSQNIYYFIETAQIDSSVN